jgi:hypothetical protein
VVLNIVSFAQNESEARLQDMRGLQEGIVKMTRYELETTPSRCQMFGEKAGLRSKQVRLLTIK